MKSTRWTIVLIFSTLWHVDKQAEVTACGQLQSIIDSRVSFGDDTIQWPWHVAIYHQKFNLTNLVYQCGGTLISSKYILTAANCVQVEADRIIVSVGRLHLNESEITAPFIKVSNVVAHPDFRPYTLDNNIAIIKLPTDVIFNNNVQPVCLWKSDRTDLSEVMDRNGTVVGWGLTEDGVMPNTLKEASLIVVPFVTCLQSNRDLYGRYLTKTTFCAGTRNGSVTACFGDDGGSITFLNDGRYYIRGVVSLTTSNVDRNTNEVVCNSAQYAVFTDVAQFLPWITKQIK